MPKNPDAPRQGIPPASVILMSQMGHRNEKPKPASKRARFHLIVPGGTSK
jgi:hypothetical protein